MNYTINHNEEFNSTEVYFEGKPSDEVREALKALRFRWHSVKKCWYGKASTEAIAAACNGVMVEAKAEPKPATVKALPDKLREIIRAEYSKAWSGKMLDYCIGRVSRAIEIESGCVFIWKKPSIKTDFCFGESGYDYDDAQRMAAHARTSTEYFKAENLKKFDEVLKALNGSGEGYYYNRTPYIRNESYSGAEDLKLCQLAWYRPCELEREIDSEKSRLRLLYENELKAIIDGYKAERAALEKRLDNYIKRYGLSKIHSWTYWRDA